MNANAAAAEELETDAATGTPGEPVREPEADRDALRLTDHAALPMAGTVRGGPLSMRYLGNSLESAGMFAHIMFKAGVGGPSCVGPYDLFARIMQGLELGIGPMEAIKELFLIEGKLGCSARLMLKLARRGGVRLRWIERTAKRACVEITVPGEQPEQFEYTIEMAAIAGLASKKNWMRFPVHMNCWRALSQGLNLMCPELLGGGLHLAEELGADTDDAGTPLLAAANAKDVKRQVKEFDDMLRGIGDPLQRKAAEPTPDEPEPKPEPKAAEPSAPKPGDHKDRVNPGLVSAIRTNAMEAGCWSADLKEVSLNGQLAGGLGLENGSYSPEALAGMINATEIIAALKARAVARVERSRARTAKANA